MCAYVTKSMVTETVGNLKDSRSPGVYNIPTKLMKNASPLFCEKLTELINDCLQSGETPEVLNIGKMALIDKKEPSLKVSNKQPLTVSSSFLSVLTKILHTR